MYKKIAKITLNNFDLTLDNLEYATVDVKEHTCSFRFGTIKNDDFSFMLSREEIRNFVDEKSYIFDDLQQIIQFRSDRIQVSPSFYGLLNSSEPSMFSISIRDKELREFCKTIQNIEPTSNINWLEVIKTSQIMMMPNVIVKYHGEAKNIITNEENVKNGIKDGVDRLVNLAKRRSNGQDDPIVLNIAPDHNSETSLVWSVVRNDQCMINGGLIWHKISAEYGVHT
jgi:hypothetical protein